jgi:hypothetical protein
MAILRVYIVDQTDLWSIILLDLDAISMAKIPVFFFAFAKFQDSRARKTVPGEISRFLQLGTKSLPFRSGL